MLAGTLLAALVYLQDLRYDFILDDVPLILTNETIASWRNWKAAFVTHIFSSNGQGLPAEIAAVHYRPVYKLWQMLHAQVFGFVLPWWHLTSLLLHIAVVFLVYRLGIKLLKDPWTAALAALLFAVHPIHAESVVYVTASTDLLVTLFLLASFLAYFHFREEGASPAVYVGSIFAAVLAMLSKETAVMFPWVLVAYEALRQIPSRDPGAGEKRWHQFAWTLPFFGIVGAYITIRYLLFGLNAGQGPGGSRLAALADVPLVLIVYLRNLIWPFRLSFFYPAEWGSQWTLLRGAAAVLVLFAAVYLWRRFRAREVLRLQLAWTAILFVPAVLGVYAFVREDWVHDRHMYLVSVPVCLLAAALLMNPRWPAKFSAAASAALFTVLLISLAFQVPRFSDDATVYETALQVAPRSVLAHQFFAERLWTYGRQEEGLREFKTVVELAPRSANAHERYGAALAQIGREEEAQAEFETALQCTSGRPDFRGFLLSEMAQLEMKHSKFTEAAAHLTEAVQLAPGILNYHALLAEALTREGRTQEAEAEMRVEAGIRQKSVQAERDSRD
jgi:tetratricopeptide (TPR) repeat protein